MTTAQTARVGSTLSRPADRSWLAQVRFGVVPLLSVIVLVMLPNVAGAYWTLIATTCALNFAIAASLNLLTGNAGQFSLGNAAFLAVGGYIGAALSVKTGMAVPVTMIIAAAAGALIGVIVGLPALRLRGIYLLMSTFAAYYIVLFAAERYQLSAFSQAGAIFPGLALGSLDLSDDRSMFYVMVVFAALVAFIIRNVMQSGYGRAFEGVKDRDIAASACGIPVNRMKLTAWALSSALIAAAGVLQAYLIGSATVEFYTFELTISYVAMILVGGLGSLGGSFLGAVFVTMVPPVISELSDRFGGAEGQAGLFSHKFELQAIVYGLITIGFVILRPDGLVGIARSVRDRISRKPVRVDG